MIHTSKDKLWMDEAGVRIPFNRTTKVERLKERHAKTILTKAIRLNNELTEFKAEMSRLCNEAYEAAMKECGAKPDAKGNYKWHSFDRSVEIETSINDKISFDDLTIIACKEKFDEFLSENIEGKFEFAKELVIDAFSTSRGSLDAKKVMSLLKYRDRVKDDKFQDAIRLLEQSIRRPGSRTYRRIKIKDENGKYQNIDLNFSSIN